VVSPYGRVFDLVATISIKLDEFDRGLNEASSKFKSFSDNLSKTGSNMKDLLSPALDGFKAVEGVGQKTGDVIKKGLTGFAAAATAVGGFGVSAVKAGMSFDATMSEVSAISGATGQDFDALRDKALEMGAKTKFSASEAASAMTYMGMAGWKAGDMISGIGGIMNLAAASGEDLALTSDIVTDALTAFGKSAGDSGHLADIMAAASSNANTNVAMLGESFKYVAPVAGALGYSMEDTSLALGLMANSGIKASSAGTALRSALTNMASPTKNMAAVMDTYKLSLTNADGSMMSLQEVMIQLREKMGGLDEATQASAASMLFGKEAMSGMLAIINAAPEDFEKLTGAIYDCNGAAEEMAATMIDNLQGDLTLLGSAFESLQIAISDALNPTLREFAQFGQQAMAELLSGFQGGGVSGFMDALSGIVTEGVTMLAEKAPEFAEVSTQFIESIAIGLIDAAPNVLTSAGEVVDILIDTIYEMAVNHGNDINEVGKNIIEFICEGFSKATDAIGYAIDEFMPLLINGFLSYHETLATAGLEILGWIGWGIKNHKDEIQSMASETIANIVTALSENAPDIIAGAIALLDALVGAIGENMPLILEVGGQIIGEIVNGISGSLPALAVVAGAIVPYIAKAIDVVTSIGNTIKSVVDAVSGGLNTIISIGSKLMGGIQALWGLIAAHPIIAVITAVIAAFLLLWNNCEEFREFFIGLWEILKEAVSGFVEWFQEAWEGVKEFFSGLWEGFMEIVTAFGEWLGEKIGEIVEWFKEQWTGIAEFFSELWEGLKEAVSLFGEWLSEKMAEIVEWVKEKWQGIAEFFTGVWEGIMAVFQGVAEFFSDVFGAAAEAVQAGWTAVVEFFSGVWDGIQAVFSVASEVLGAFFTAAAEAVQAVWEGVSAFFQSVWDGIRAVFEPVAEVLSGFFQAAWEAVQAAWEAATEFFGSVWDGIQTVFSDVADVLGGFFEAAWEAVESIWEAAVDFFTGVADGIHEVFEAVTEFLSETFQAAWDAVQDAWSAAKEFFSDLWNAVKEAATSAATAIGDALKQAWDAVKDAWNSATEFFKGILDSIINVFDGIWTTFKGIGGDIVDGIKDGVTGAWDSFVSFMSNKISGIINSVKEKLGIHSPSKVFAGIGENMALGLAEGWGGEYSGIKRQIESGMDFAPVSVGLTASGLSYSQAAQPFQTPAAQGAAAGNTFNFTFNSPKAMNPVEAAREARKASQLIALQYV